MKQEIKSRHLILMFIFMTVCLVFIYRLFNLQIINGRDYLESSSRNIIKETVIKAPRGKILDRNGNLIAGSELFIDMQMQILNRTDKYKNDLYLKVINILEKNKESLNSKLSEYLSFNPLRFKKDDAVETAEWQKRIFNIKKTIEDPIEFMIFLRDKFFKVDLEVDDETLYKVICLRYNELIGKDIDTSFTLAENLSYGTIAEITERSHELPGIWLKEIYKRKYYNAESAAHVLGYIGSIGSESYSEMKNEGYSINDKIGKSGVELQAERYLKGTDGRKWLEIDTGGKYVNEIIGIPAERGNDVVLTLDMQIQEIAVASLKENIEIIRNKQTSKSNFNDANAGAVVAIDVNSGEIIAMASYPTYDPSVFLAGTDSYNEKVINALYNDSNRPIFNRAIQGSYAPGSTFKPLIGITAMEENKITKNTIIDDIGYINIGNQDFFCLEYTTIEKPHGEINLIEALTTSCNIFFHIIAHDTGIDSISKWAGIFRLGELTGIDLPFEAKGTRPSREYKEITFKDIWRPADTAQIGIGQLYNDYTPVQLASYVSSIANGGTFYKPHIIKSIYDEDGVLIIEAENKGEKLPVKKETIDAVKEGMVAVANSIDGTAVRVFKDFPFEVAGKTGTAETGREANHSSNALFIAYAPADNPKIAVAAVIEKGVWGAWTAPVTKDIMEKYFEIYGDELYNNGSDISGILTK